VVALDPVQANFLRIAELLSELGESKAAAEAFKQIAQLTAASGEDPAQWYERAYQEDSSDEGIALAYGKSLLGQGQIGAAIFILEPQVNCWQDLTHLAGYLCRGSAGGGTLRRRGAAGVATV
jgi:predicted Zn-dependent protease